MTALPLTVIAGYLGAGKTTLINGILTAPQGRRLLIMVNDFGAINVDASLLKSRDEDTIALSNGCVCCTMGADLFLAIGDVLDRTPRPDHLIIEASGVSDPARIANVALAEPDLGYAGIVTVVDGSTFGTLTTDPLVGPQVRQQITSADLVWVSKEPDEHTVAAVKQQVSVPVLTQEDPGLILSLLADVPKPSKVAPKTDHVQFVSWHADGVTAVNGATLRDAFAARPPGLFRVKGNVRDKEGKVWLVQAVGRQITIAPVADDLESALVGIGPESVCDLAAVETWWAALQDGA